VTSPWPENGPGDVVSRGEPGGERVRRRVAAIAPHPRSQLD
jgi:hypothetical protein